MRGLIRRLDAFLRSRNGIFPCVEREDCLLQLQISRAPRLLVFPDEEIGAGEPVLLLHLWNDHLPLLPPGGPDLTWASRARHLFLKSLASVAERIRADASLAPIRAVGGRTALFTPDGRSGGARLLRRLGFTVIPCQRGLGGRPGEFLEDLYAALLIWTYNPNGPRARWPSSERRSEFWMPVGDFLRRFGGDGTPAGGETPGGL